MNGLTILFLLVNALALLVVPRRWAPLPLLVGTCFMTMGQEIEIGPFHFTVMRILVAAGFMRVILRGERLTGGLNGLDGIMLAWAAWMLMSSLFHESLSEALTFRLGLVYNACGIYFLLRMFCQSVEDVVRLCRVTAILLVPLAVEMFYEKLTDHNLFSMFGGVLEHPLIREDKIRAQGPFAHPILAGTIGAVCLPFMIGLRRQQRKTGLAGVAACIVIIFASASSGPIMSAAAAVAALWMWRYRGKMVVVRWMIAVGYVFLDLVMSDPAYFLIARIDLAGGSTGWYRARLIQSAFEHLGDWWMAGTDYTRNWMHVYITANENHTDITNHYLYMGVTGGLPLMLLFVAVLVRAFSFVGRAIRQQTGLPPEQGFMIWAFGSSLFAHAVTFISISYFDQSVVFLYLTLAAIGSLYSPGPEIRVQSFATAHAMNGLTPGVAGSPKK